MAVPIAGMLNQLMNFVVTKWYLIVVPLLFIGIFIAILSIIKLKKKLLDPTYWDQIKYTFKIVLKELSYSPSPIKFIKHFDLKYKSIGHCQTGVRIHKDVEVKQRTTHRYTFKDIRDMEIKAMKEAITGDKKPDFIIHRFSIQRNKFLGLFYMGEKEILILKDTEITQIKSNTVRIHDLRSLIYRKGFLCTQSPEMLSIVDELHERVMSDHLVDSRGQQMKDFSRVRTDYAHEEKMKDKDVELEEKKDRNRRMG